MTHSLEAAVADGTISERAAFCGLSMSDITKLGAAHPTAIVLVRLRSLHGDGRITMTASELVDWRTDYRQTIARASGGEKRYSDGVAYGYGNVRDVLPVRERGE